jgi:sulfoxide reductase heme-binding subunit YedZ
MQRRTAVQTAAIALGLLPLVALGVRALRDGLGANPIEELTHRTGEATLQLLLATLAVTPLRRWLGLAWLAPLRRTLGLLAFGYATLHLCVYITLDRYFEWNTIAEDVGERPYITIGFLGFLCLLPLALTSTRASMRRLGRRWVALHRLAYVAAIAGVIHFLWLVKADHREPLIYASLLALLLLVRLPRPALR